MDFDLACILCTWMNLIVDQQNYSCCPLLEQLSCLKRINFSFTELDTVQSATTPLNQNDFAVNLEEFLPFPRLIHLLTSSRTENILRTPFRV